MEPTVDLDRVGAETPSEPAVDIRVYRAGFIAGAIALIALLGVIKDLGAILAPGGSGQFVWGFLVLRYSSLERVWFGYLFTGYAAWLATFPHLVLYAASIYSLMGLRRWGWYLVFAYMLYIPLSEWVYMFLYPLGYLTSRPYPEPILRTEWLFLLIGLPLELSVVGLLWWYRGLFVR
jgi:hypothetical protein